MRAPGQGVRGRASAVLRQPVAASRLPATAGSARSGSGADARKKPLRDQQPRPRVPRIGDRGQRQDGIAGVGQRYPEQADPEVAVKLGRQRQQRKRWRPTPSRPWRFVAGCGLLTGRTKRHHGQLYPATDNVADSTGASPRRGDAPEPGRFGCRSAPDGRTPRGRTAGGHRVARKRRQASGAVGSPGRAMVLWVAPGTTT